MYLRPSLASLAVAHISYTYRFCFVGTFGGHTKKLDTLLLYTSYPQGYNMESLNFVLTTFH